MDPFAYCFCRTTSLNDLARKRVSISRRFKNDTERPERLFDLYIKMIVADADTAQKADGKAVRG